MTVASEPQVPDGPGMKPIPPNESSARRLRTLGVATEQPRFAQGFMDTTGLKGVISTDIELLRKTFPFVDPPAGVALENGHQKASLTKFEGEEPESTLKKLKFVN